MKKTGKKKKDKENEPGKTEKPAPTVEKRGPKKAPGKKGKEPLNAAKVAEELDKNGSGTYIVLDVVSDSRVITARGIVKGMAAELTIQGKPSEFMDAKLVTQPIVDLLTKGGWQFKLVPKETPDAFTFGFEKSQVLDNAEGKKPGKFRDDHFHATIGALSANLYLGPVKANEFPGQLDKKSIELLMQEQQHDQIPAAKRPNGQTGFEDFNEEENEDEESESEDQESGEDTGEDITPTVIDNRKPATITDLMNEAKEEQEKKPEETDEEEPPKD